MDEQDLSTDVVAQRVVDALIGSGETLAVAESLTGGLLSSAVVAVPGASAAFRGGIVAYATEAKERLLAVEPAALAETGPVDPTVAVQMAMGVRWRMDATWSLSTTGVAGPDPQPDDPHGVPVGTVYLGIAGPRIGQAVKLELGGGREEIRQESTRQALMLLGIALGVIHSDGDQVVEEGAEEGTGVGAGEGADVDLATAEGEQEPGNKEDESRVPLM